MKKNGFTLIEIIAVVVILGLILLIIVPNVNDILKRSKTTLNERQKELIISAARNWGMENLTSTSETMLEKITIKTLQDNGFLEDKEVKNLLDKSDLSSDTVICIQYKNSQYIYTYEEDELEGGGKCR